MDEQPIPIKTNDVRRATRSAELSSMAERRFERYARPNERKHVGERINPATAIVFVVYAQTLDPYGDDPHLPEELRQMGCEYFVFDPGELIAVSFNDLPLSTLTALYPKWNVVDRETWRVILVAAAKT
jgi:hypothetical protein